MDDDLGAVLRHYESGREELRLSAGLGELELVRTQEVLRRHLPPPPATILDIGGGTGVHAAWLLAAGYTVRLLDLSPRHVARALADLARMDSRPTSPTPVGCRPTTTVWTRRCCSDRSTTSSSQRWGHSR